MEINEQEGIKKHLTWMLVLKVALGLTLIIYLLSLTRNEFTKHDYIGRADNQVYTITISGQGEVTATPDIAQVDLGVQTENKSVATAQKENSDKMKSIIAGIKELGIEDKDIKTQNYNIYPQYDYTNNRQTLRGYQVYQSVQVKIRDLSKISTILGLAGDNGANQIGGLNFTIDDPEELKQQAREMALTNAKEKGDALAKVAGVKLGKLVSFNENFDNSYPVPYRSFDVANGLGGFGGDNEAAPDIQAGSQDIIVNVSVTYEVL